MNLLARIGIGHPSLRALHRWADGEDVPIDGHLATCERCANRLEPLLEESEGDLRAALLRLLRMPDELPQTIRSAIEEHERNQRDMALIGELFGLPLRAARLMATDQEDD